MPEYRRRLPHFHPEGAYLFITWRLHNSLPAQSLVSYPTPGHAFAAQDRALALNRNVQHLSDPRVAQFVADTLLAGETRTLYELHAWVIMPNHVHILILPQSPLPQITQWIKGRTARQANLLLARSGQPFWQHESYDHWVRTGKEFNRIVSYIESNPVTAGLAPSPEAYPWSSAHRNW